MNKDIEENINKILKMNLSEPFINLLKELIDAIEKDKKTIVWTMVDNLYPSVKLENISQEEQEYIKEFLLSL